MSNNLNIISTKLEINYSFGTDVSVVITDDSFEGSVPARLDIMATEDEIAKDAIHMEFNDVQDMKEFGQFIIDCADDFITKFNTIKETE